MSVWDELWNEIAVDGITQESNVSNSWVRNILNRVKVEGDKFKEKAEKWDEAQELLDVLIRYGVIVPFEDGWKVLPAALKVQPSTETET